MKSSRPSAMRKPAGVTLGEPHTDLFVLDKRGAATAGKHKARLLTLFPNTKSRKRASGRRVPGSGSSLGPDQTGIEVLATINSVTRPSRQGLLLAQEAVGLERRRMAADVHDTLCQDLHALLLLLQMSEEELPPRAGNARLYMHRAQDVAREVLVEARRTMWAFTHESVAANDPGIALARRAKHLFADTSVKLRLSLPKGTKSMSPQMRSGLYRIGKEALTNVRKHAQATRVRLEIVYERRQVKLAVEDDGCGFEGAAAPSLQNGYGMTSMRQRAERMGGKLMVQSRLNFGTRVVALVPFAMQDAHWRRA
jgi:signal transduction histidine kinase